MNEFFNVMFPLREIFWRLKEGGKLTALDWHIYTEWRTALRTKRYKQSISIRYNKQFSILMSFNIFQTYFRFKYHFSSVIFIEKQYPVSFNITSCRWIRYILLFLPFFLIWIFGSILNIYDLNQMFQSQLINKTMVLLLANINFAFMSPHGPFMGPINRRLNT